MGVVPVPTHLYGAEPRVPHSGPDAGEDQRVPVEHVVGRRLGRREEKAAEEAGGAQDEAAEGPAGGERG